MGRFDGHIHKSRCDRTLMTNHWCENVKTVPLLDAILLLLIKTDSSQINRHQQTKEDIEVASLLMNLNNERCAMGENGGIRRGYQLQSQSIANLLRVIQNKKNTVNLYNTVDSRNNEIANNECTPNNEGCPCSQQILYNFILSAFGRK